MKIELTFLKSKVARRIFVLFVFCALVPISAMALLAFTQVKGELEKQSQRRLHEISRSLGTSIYERLFFLVNDLRVLTLSRDVHGEGAADKLGKELSEHLGVRFKQVSLITPAGKSVPLLGVRRPPPKLSPDQIDHLNSGKPLLMTEPVDERDARIYLLTLANSPDNGGVIFAEINALYLWDLHEHDTLPTMTELCILDGMNRVVFSTHPVPRKFRRTGAFREPRSSVSRLQWEYDGREYLAGYWSVFLEYHFLFPKFTVVMSSTRDYILSPMAYFRKIFPSVAFLSFLVVLLLSVIQIRRTTQPLEKLREGTRRIADRDFDTRVSVDSGDEFEDLGSSFNHMSRQLGRQFGALTTMAEIDRAILSSLDTKEIVRTVIRQLKDFFLCRVAGVILLDPPGEDAPTAYMEADKFAILETADQLKMEDHEQQEISGVPWTIYPGEGPNLPSYLQHFPSQEVQDFVILPVSLHRQLAALIVLGTGPASPVGEEDLLHARQVADQVAIALANARLLEDLDAMNWGALTALARTVDAKSPWTAGHSERVTQTALEIGRDLGIRDGELENLHRGGLLHDIGKIGIPVSILDKPGRLTEAEYQMVQAHSRMGARILEPVVAYSSVVPMVLQHHERFDGKGYPEGISGKAINLGARVLAVADVFDSLISDRPYRKAMARDQVIQIIREGAGRQFDPDVVQAFLEILKRKREKEKSSGEWPREREQQTEGLGR